MPFIQFGEILVDCKVGENLRKVLLRNKLSPYNGPMKYLNCHGIGSCGTCAVHIEGEVGPKTFMEKWRLKFPPHEDINNLRLACQVKVNDNLKVTKGGGLWGEKP